MTKFAIAVRTNYSDINAWRPRVIEIKKITKCFVMAHHRRYNKNVFKFLFFNDRETAEREFQLMRIRCDIDVEDNAREKWLKSRNTATEKVKEMVKTWG